MICFSVLVNRAEGNTQKHLYITTENVFAAGFWIACGCIYGYLVLWADIIVCEWRFWLRILVVYDDSIESYLTSIIGEVTTCASTCLHSIRPTWLTNSCLRAKNWPAKMSVSHWHIVSAFLLLCIQLIQFLRLGFAGDCMSWFCCCCMPTLWTEGGICCLFKMFA